MYDDENRWDAVQYKDHKKVKSLENKTLTVCQYEEQGKEMRHRTFGRTLKSVNKLFQKTEGKS